MSKHINILEHDVSWWVKSPAIKELDTMQHSHIYEQIRLGISSGELVVYYDRHERLTTTGWWEIINWQSIATELYHCLNETINRDDNRARIALKDFCEKHG